MGVCVRACDANGAMYKFSILIYINQKTGPCIAREASN